MEVFILECQVIFTFKSLKFLKKTLFNKLDILFWIFELKILLNMQKNNIIEI